MTTQTDTQRLLRMTRRFEASPERVFDAWLNSELANRWLFASQGDESFSAQRDLRVGGQWTITARRAGVDYTAVGEYLAIERPHRLVFSFGMPQFSPNIDTISVEFAPDGEGCLMTFTQSGTDIAAELEQLSGDEQGSTELGWLDMFSNLIGVLTGEETPKLQFSLQLPASPDQVYDYLIEPELMRQWLYPGTDTIFELDLTVGGKWSITRFADGETYTASGVYVLIDRPLRLVYTFAMLQFSPNSDNLSLELVPAEMGCILHFSQIGPDIAQELRDLAPGEVSASEKGWREGFEGLKRLLQK